MSGLDLFIDTFFRPDLIARYLPAIAQAMVITLELAVCIVISGLALGIGLALLRAFGVRVINFFIIVFSDVNRALPPLVLVLLTYFGLPSFGINLPSFAVLWVVLSLVLAAFSEEIFWAGILSVRRGQWDAARSTGLSFAQTLLFVVFPQALKLTVPPLTNRTIVIIKNTALGSIIGVPEILNVASTAESFVGNITPLTLGAIAYLVLFAPVTVFGRWLEARFAWKRIVMNVAQQFFNIDVMMRVAPIVLRGLWMTVEICMAVIPLGLFGGLLVAIVMQTRWRALRAVVAICIDFFRALPPLFLLILLYAGSPIRRRSPNPVFVRLLGLLSQYFSILRRSLSCRLRKH